MSFTLNGVTYSKNGIGTPNGDRFVRVVLNASVSGTPTAGTSFSALTISASITLPDVGINTPITVTGFTRSAGTVVQGTNSITILWKSISKTITFTGVAGGGGDTNPLTLSSTSLSLALNAEQTLIAGVNSAPVTASWSSSNTSAVTVTPTTAGAKVKVVGSFSGTVTITATYMGKTATCSVTYAGGGEVDPGEGDDEAVPGTETVTLIHKWETFTAGQAAADTVGSVSLASSSDTANKLWGKGVEGSLTADSVMNFGYNELTVIMKCKIDITQGSMPFINFSNNGSSNRLGNGGVQRLSVRNAGGEGVSNNVGAGVTFFSDDASDLTAWNTYTTNAALQDSYVDGQEKYMTIALELDMRSDVKRFALWVLKDDQTAKGKAGAKSVPGLKTQGFFVGTQLSGGSVPSYVEVWSGLKFSKDTGIEVS